MKGIRVLTSIEDDSGTDSSASKGTAGWRKDRKRKRALRNLSRSPEPGSARQGPSGITQVAAKLGMSSASDTRDGSGAKGHSAGPSKKRNKKNKKNSAKKQSSTAQAAPTSAGASTGPSSLPRTDYLEEMYDEYPFRTYVEALKLANEEKAEEARVLFGETGELFQPGDNPPGSLYFTGLSSLNIERGWSWYKMRIPNLPLDLGEGDQADVKKRRIIVGTVMVLRIGWLLEKVEVRGFCPRSSNESNVVILARHGA